MDVPPTSTSPPTPEELVRIFEGLGLVTRAPRMAPLLQQIWRVAHVSDATILIEGESGTGKMVVAEAIHRLDPKRCRHPFVTAPCAVIPASVAESELFGHARGAFSGAVEERLGLFRSGDRGTVFLDDISDLPLSLQPKLLDVLQRRTVRAVGSDREHRVDVRTIAATNTPLDALVAKGAFRADLLFRLNVIQLRLPPLRERGEDMAALVLALARRHEDLYGPIRCVEPALAARLAQATLPGNVRELEHLVQRMLFAKRAGDTLALADLPLPPEDEGGLDRACDAAAEGAWAAICAEGIRYGEALRRFEHRLLGRALESAVGTRRELAARLGISERCLYKKMRALRIAPDWARSEETDRTVSAPAREVSVAVERPRRTNADDRAGAPPDRD
jgi:two-component system, NtrC family, response regulator AtoC